MLAMYQVVDHILTEYLLCVRHGENERKDLVPTHRIITVEEIHIIIYYTFVSAKVDSASYACL